jgi:hypothetical protein
MWVLVWAVACGEHPHRGQQWNRLRLNRAAVGSDHKETVMNPICALGRLARILAGPVVAAPTALATPRPRPSGWNKHPPLPATTQPALRYPPGWNKHPPLPDPARLHAALAGGMPGWQITLLAAAVLTAAAVLLARARAARRRAAATPA